MSRDVLAAGDEILARFLRDELVDARLRSAHEEFPTAYELVMAAVTWEKVDRGGWRTASELSAQVGRWRALGRIDGWDDESVVAAVAWSVAEPALLESDRQGRYRPVGGILPLGADEWLSRLDDADQADTLTPLEWVAKGDRDRQQTADDQSAAEACYRRAATSEDPDAARSASLRLADLAEVRGQAHAAFAAFTDVAAREHPIASPPAHLWLAEQAAASGDTDAARAFAERVVANGGHAVVDRAWMLLSALAWDDHNYDEAMVAMRRAIDAAGPMHRGYTERLGLMLVETGDLAAAAAVFGQLLDDPLMRGRAADSYVRAMVAAGRADEAVAVLETHTSDIVGGAEALLALFLAHGARGDDAAAAATIGRIRERWDARSARIAVRADLAEAALAVAIGDDTRASELYSAVTDSDDTAVRDIARPHLIAMGQQLAARRGHCAWPRGRGPLLEYLSEAAPPATAAWAARSVAHRATVDGRPDDAEAAVRLVGRLLGAVNMTVLRAELLQRGGRRTEAVAYLVDACCLAPAEDLSQILAALSQVAGLTAGLTEEQRARVRAAVWSVIDCDGARRHPVALALAEVELFVCFDHLRAGDLWRIAADSDEPSISATAWMRLGDAARHAHPTGAAHAYDNAMRAGDPAVAAQAAAWAAAHAEHLPDPILAARTSEYMLDFAHGDELAQAALRIGATIEHRHPDDAEDAYLAAVGEPGATPATVGTGLARLGALYARQGNRREAERTWRRGRRHRDPDVVAAFAVERAVIGRVSRLDRRLLPAY